MRKLFVLCIFALVITLTVPAFAEVQNVKISGEISLYGLYRDNYYTTGSGGGTPATLTVNLGRRDLAGATSNTFTNCKAEDWYMQTTRLSVDADLTDNVIARVSLFSESDWPVTESTAGHASNPISSSAEKFDVELLEGYIVLKEMLYSQLTLKIGNQPVRIGRGLILGDGDLSGNGLIASDYSISKSFNGIAGILDYNPLTVILGIVKISDKDTTSDDVDGYLADFIYRFDAFNAVLDMSYVLAHYASPAGGLTTGPSMLSQSADDVHGLDIILSGSPFENLNGYIEFGKEFGDFVSNPAGGTSRDLDAWAFDVGGAYSIDNEYAPVVGLSYGRRSGEKAGTSSGDYKGWIPLFEDQKNGEILDPNTNVSWVKLALSARPIERLTTTIDYYLYRHDQKVVNADTTVRRAKRDLGDEVDMNLTYAYTDDLTFGLLYAIFWPGDSYTSGNDKKTVEAVASVNLKF
ncbi:MAG: alginate export family protein [Candidatus Omnitrophota bacterium]